MKDRIESVLLAIVVGIAVIGLAVHVAGIFEGGPGWPLP